MRVSVSFDASLWRQHACHGLSQPSNTQDVFGKALVEINELEVVQVKQLDVW